MIKKDELFSFIPIMNAYQKELSNIELCDIKGKVCEVIGNVVKAIIPNACIGETCLLINANNNQQIYAEVIGFVNSYTLLAPVGSLQGISHSTAVIMTGKIQEVPVGNALLGRVIDAFSQPKDGLGPIQYTAAYPLYNTSPDPLKRKIIRDPLILGIKAIDGLLTMGLGQRIGIFAAAGVGKTTLISSVIKGAQVDVIILGLIGERGREVREFIEFDIGKENLHKTVIVFATSDCSSMERARAAFVATTVAEYFRDKGLNVLLMIDSITRFARAIREIGLSAGEVPTRRGFPSSVFTNIPKLIERAGTSEHGSISAIYTVLVEGDDMTEPVADETKSILDGHIVLASKLAEEKHYPAIDVLASISRIRNNIITNQHKQMADKVIKLISKYKEVEFLLKVGEYKKGANPLIDEAISKNEIINQFLCQDLNNNFSLQETMKILSTITNSASSTY